MLAIGALRAERGDDLAGARVAGIGRVAWIGFHHDDLHDVAGQRASRFGDLVSDEDSHVGGHFGGRVRRVSLFVGVAALTVRSPSRNAPLAGKANTMAC